MNTPTLAELNKTRDELQAKLDEVNATIKLRMSQTIVRCPNKDCLRGYEIRELEYFQEQYYVEPFSCTGGDYWVDSETDAHWNCPVCGTTTRLYDKPDIRALKKLFKTVTKWKPKSRY